MDEGRQEQRRSDPYTPSLINPLRGEAMNVKTNAKVCGVKDDEHNH